MDRAIDHLTDDLICLWDCDYKNIFYVFLAGFDEYYIDIMIAQCVVK